MFESFDQWTAYNSSSVKMLFLSTFICIASQCTIAQSFAYIVPLSISITPIEKNVFPFARKWSIDIKQTLTNISKWIWRTFSFDISGWFGIDWNSTPSIKCRYALCWTISVITRALQLFIHRTNCGNNTKKKHVM